MMDCKQCSNLAQELAEVEKELAEAEKEVKRLADMIEKVAGFSSGFARAAATEMRGNVPQGRFAFLKSQWENLNGVLYLLERPTIPLKPKKKKGLAGIGQGLFEGLFGG